MKPLLKGIEVWALSPDSGTLRLVDGSYGDLHRFAEVSRTKRFAFEKGLPGKAWAFRRPVMLKTSSPEFERREAALDARITTAIAWPVFAGDYLLAVVVFLCGDDEETLGAIEVWHCDTTQSYDMRLADGYFGQLSRFELLSKVTAFRKGTGLVGTAWETGMPTVMADLGRSHRFLRSEGAVEAGLTMGLAIPATFGHGQDYVLTFLSARATPVARQIEIWKPDAQRRTLGFHAGYSEQGLDLTERYGDVKLSLHDGALGGALLTGLPNLRRSLSGTPAEGIDHLERAAVLPVLEAGRAKAIVALYT